MMMQKQQLKSDYRSSGTVTRIALAALAAVVFAAPGISSAQASKGAARKDSAGTVRTLTIQRPDGYIGIIYSGDERVQSYQHKKDDKVVELRTFVSYAAYPVVVSVEPGSPAERAGLTAGDTLLAYNGQDLTAAPLPLHDMLKPGARLNVRVRRDGVVRTAAVTVANRPAAFARGARGVSVAPARPPVAMLPTPEVQAEVRRELERAREQIRRELETNRELTEKQREQLRRELRSTEAARAAAERVRAAPEPRPAAPIAFTVGSVAGVAGAEMTPLNSDLADLVRVRQGVFVVKVNPGTPAERSGLRSGDVIIAVGDSAVADVAQLRRAMTAEQRRVRAGAGERTLPLRIVRKQRRHTLTLRW